MSRRKACEFCGRRFKNLKLHMRKSECGSAMPDEPVNEPVDLVGVAPTPNEPRRLTFYGPVTIYVS